MELGPSQLALKIPRHATILLIFSKRKDRLSADYGAGTAFGILPLIVVTPSGLQAEHHASPFDRWTNRSGVCVCVCVCARVRARVLGVRVGPAGRLVFLYLKPRE